jgi:hypothetical protein
MRYGKNFLKLLWYGEQHVAEVPAVRSDCGASLPVQMYLMKMKYAV